MYLVLALALAGAVDAQHASQSPLELTVTVTGVPWEVWNRSMRVMSHAGYRGSSADMLAGRATGMSLARGIGVSMQFTQVAADSVRIVVTGRRYAAEPQTAGRVSMRAQDWPPILATDSVAKHLTAFVEALRSAESTDLAIAARRWPTPPITWALPGLPPQPPQPDTGPRVGYSIRRPGQTDLPLRSLPDGRRAYCKANAVRDDDWLIVDNVTIPDWCPLDQVAMQRLTYNAYVLENPHDKPIGTVLEVCAVSNVPRGWQTLELRTIAGRCPHDPGSPRANEPNMAVLRRVR
jgi:hypothetical protein